MKSGYVVVAACVTVNVVLAALLVLDVPQASAPPLSADTEAVTTYWSERVDAVGERMAYREFLQWAGVAGITRQHELAHIMGGLLYTAVGKIGLTVCDSSFSFGCFHEFLGQAIHAEGLAVVSELNNACVETLGLQALSCQHGIGHGIQTFLGYDVEALKRSLAECRELPYTDPVGGCYGGAFMEYNMRTMLSLDGVEPREDGDPMQPCAGLDEAYLPACYYWQPQWWVAVGAGALEGIYQSMGEYCREAGTSALTQKCFEGVGNISGQTANYNPARTIELCDIAAAGDSKQALYCRADAANSYFVIPAAQVDAVRVCDGLTGDAYEYCYKYSDNTLNQAVVAGEVQ